MKLADLKPLQRKALAAALDSPTFSFVRSRRGWIAEDAMQRGDELPIAFTLRLMRMMDRDYLLDFDNDGFPMRATLTMPGRQLAEQMPVTQRTKAGAA